MSVKFLPTPEQQHISSSLISAVLFEENRYKLSVQAPAGTGKTQLTAHFMKELQEISPEKKIGYFIFNSFMKKEIDKRAYVMDINNSQFFTYHSFLLRHAMENEKLKEHFHDKEGNPIIDFAKHGYKREELSDVSRVILGQNNETLSMLLDLTFNSWLNSDTSITECAKGVSSDVFTSECELNEEEETITMARLQLAGICRALSRSKNKIISRQSKSPSGDLPLESLLSLYLAQGITNIMKTKKLSHSAYYKEVYTLALKHQIDLFSEFDVIIVDEAQDMDNIFKQLVLLSNKPLMLIGDGQQSIYAWRGAVNMMEDVEKDPKTEKCSLSYSFRYKNDIAQLSNLLLLGKKEKPSVLVSGKYTTATKSIDDELSTARDIGESVVEAVRKRLYLCEMFEGLSFMDMNKKDLTKFLSREKIAFISRNNHTLVDAIFDILPVIRKSELSPYISISLTDSVSDDFGKIRKGDFGGKINSQIEQRIGEPYSTYKKDKTILDLMQNNDIRNVLFENRKFDYLLDNQKLDNFIFLLDELSSRSQDSISKNDEKANFVMTTVHGSKGKEYEQAILSSDILMPNKDGIISDEEYHVGYVAVTRAKKRLSFYQGWNNDYHPIFSLYKRNESNLSSLLHASFTYTFPFDVHMRIEEESGLYHHFIENKKTGSLGFFALNLPITSGMVGYWGEECKEHIKYYDMSEKKEIILSFDGENIDTNKKDNITDYYFGVGKSDTSLLDDIRRNNHQTDNLVQKKSEEILPVSIELAPH